MPLLDTSAKEAIARALDSAPNAKIDPRIWQEISRLQRGLGEMAGLVDAVNNPPGGTYGGVPVHMYLQEQTVVTARALRSFGAYEPARLILSGGELKADWCNYSSAPTIFTRCDAVTPAAVGAGAMGAFILRGIAAAYATQINSKVLNITHSRIFASGHLRYNFFTGSPGYGDRDYAIAGTFIHAYSIRSISTILMYFNPERTWMDKGFT